MTIRFCGKKIRAGQGKRQCFDRMIVPVLDRRADSLLNIEVQVCANGSHLTGMLVMCSENKKLCSHRLVSCQLKADLSPSLKRPCRA